MSVKVKRLLSWLTFVPAFNNPTVLGEINKLGGRGTVLITQSTVASQALSKAYKSFILGGLNSLSYSSHVPANVKIQPQWCYWLRKNAFYMLKFCADVDSTPYFGSVNGAIVQNDATAT